MHWRACDLIDQLRDERRTALIFIDEHGHRRDYTFAEIATYSSRYAAVLRAFGLREDERVYLRLSPTGKCIFTLLALERLGAHAVFDESAAAGASTIVSDRTYRSVIEASRTRFSPDVRYVVIGEEREGWARLDTLAQVASPVSGELQFDQAALDRAREDARAQLAALTTDVVWCTLPIADRGWFRNAIVQPWLCGCAAVSHSGRFDPRERLDLVRELDVTILQQCAADYHAELALPDSIPFKLPRLRRCSVFGEGCDELLQAQWRERFGVPLTPDAAAAV